MHKCGYGRCDYTSEHKHHLTRHIKNVHLKSFKCKHCNKKFFSNDEKIFHEKSHAKVKNLKRKHNEKEVSNKKKNIETLTPPPQPPPPPIPPSPPPPRMFNGRFRNMIFTKNYKLNSKNDLIKLLVFYKKVMKSEMVKKLSQFEKIKFHIVANIKFLKYKEDEMIFTTNYFNGGQKIVLLERDLDEKLDSSIQEIQRRVEEFINNGSGWVYEETIEVSLNVFKYHPTRGGTFIQMPNWIKNKKVT